LEKRSKSVWTDGKHADNRTPIAEKEYEEGVLHLRDLGYFNLSRLKAQT